MKKKLLIIILSVVMILPNVVNAKNYEQSTTTASTYLEDNRAIKSSYKNYLLYNTNKYDFYKVHDSEIEKFDTGLFKYGGLLSKEEFDLTKYISSKDYGKSIDDIPSYNSYLYGSKLFWTLTSAENDPQLKYVVGDRQNNYNDKDETIQQEVIYTRVTEYVDTNTKVTGAGTYSDPWYFIPKYNVKVIVNNPNYGEIKVNGNSYNQFEFNYDGVGINDAFIVSPKQGYNYLGNTCNGIIIDKGGTAFDIKAVTKDYTCEIIFGVSQYNINFSGGSCPTQLTGTMSNMTNILYDQEIALRENKFVCDGYEFDGWLYNPNPAESDEDKIFDNRALVKELCLENDCSVTLTAQWKSNSTIIELDYNNATSPVFPNGIYTMPEPVVYNKKISNIEDIVPQREYNIQFNYEGVSPKTSTYTFNGFEYNGSLYINEKGEGIKVWNHQVDKAKLVAQWSGGEITLPNISEPGKVFNGWFTSGVGGTKVGNGGEKYTPKVNTTLYPQFTNMTYTIEFNGGNCSSTLTGNMNSISKGYTDVVTLTNGFSCSGHNFAGWVSDTGLVFQNNQEVSGVNFGINSNSTTIKLTAQWGGGGFLEDFNDGNANNNGFTFTNSTFEISDNRYYRTGGKNTVGMTGGGNSSDYITNMFNSGVLSSYEFTAKFTPQYDGIFKYDYSVGDVGFGWNMIATLTPQNGSSRQIAAISICNDYAKGMPFISGICLNMDGSDLPSSPRIGTPVVNVQAGVTYTFKLKVAGYPGYSGDPYVDNLEVIYN